MTIFRTSIIKSTALVFAMSVTVGACSSNPLQLDNDPEPISAAAEIRAEAGILFRLRPGQSAAIGGELLVAFRGVKSDSRCPAGVACVWAGDAEAVVGLAVERGSWTWTSLHTGVEPRATSAHGYSVRLVDIEPGAVVNAGISAEHYVAVLEVVRQ